MNRSVALATPSGEFLIPEERALLMIEACAKQIGKAGTIPDVKRVISQAEAIDAVMRKIKASKEARQAALILLLEAEQQLGRVTAQIPKGIRGKGAKPGQPTKRGVLNKHGLHHFRCLIAEKLAEMPKESVEEAAARAKTPTVFGVTAALGLRNGFVPQPPRRMMKKVAMDAIGLLVSCQTHQRAPLREEVDPLREAFANADSLPGG